MTMTNEELDKARAKEARRIWREQPLYCPTTSEIAARLAREGWEPADPDLIAVREIVATYYEATYYEDRGWVAENVKNGLFDSSAETALALAAYKAGVAKGRGDQ